VELRRRRVRAPRGMWGSVSAAALLVWLAGALPAWAQDNVIGTATLPRDLSPWGMFLNADPVVKAVLVGLAFASLVTWTVWLAKTIELKREGGRARRRLRMLKQGGTLRDAVRACGTDTDAVAQLIVSTAREAELSA